MDSFNGIKILAPVLNHTNRRINSISTKRFSPFLLDDNIGEMDIIDTRKVTSLSKNSGDDTFLEEVPNKIMGTYTEDYNILHVDEIIHKKLTQEKYTHLTYLKSKYKSLENESSLPQTYLMREKTFRSMMQIQEEIEEIETGTKIRTYISRVADILSEYKKYNGKVKTISFGIEEEKYKDIDDDLRYRIYLIDSYLDIASKYIHVDVIRINNRPSDICIGCGASLIKVAINEGGTIRCPNEDCQIEHHSVILSKLSKDGPRLNINSSSEDESIDNFMKAFVRYQGLQPDRPDESLYEELDAYFSRNGRPSSKEIRNLPLNSRGERGDTNHAMLWDALSKIGRPQYYEDVNLIGNIYWEWTLPDVMHLKERIIDKYNKTQRVYYRIPVKERCRNSSLGTQLRLWLHLQLEGHECYMDQFKIAENLESLRNQKALWKLMCEGANDPDIYYIS